MNNTVVSAIGFLILAIIMLLNYNETTAANEKLDQLEKLLEQHTNPEVFCNDLEGLRDDTEDPTFQAKLDTLIQEYCG